MKLSEPPRSVRRRTTTTPYVTTLATCFALLYACNISPVPSPTGSSGGQVPVEFGDTSTGGAEDTTFEDILFGAADTGIQIPDNDNNIKNDASACSADADGETRIDEQDADRNGQIDSELSQILPDSEADAPPSDNACP